MIHRQKDDHQSGAAMIVAAISHAVFVRSDMTM
jgi:hypothetical protein